MLASSLCFYEILSFLFILSQEGLGATAVSHIAGNFFPESHKNPCLVESLSGP